MNRDQVTEKVGEIAASVARDSSTTDASFVLDVYGRVVAEAPDVIEYLEAEHPESDPYQALKWFIPDDLGFTTS
jgi:hypothetical protein